VSRHIVLAGNPNCGKTVLFNALTGMQQRVGNWPGVTVEYKQGAFRHADEAFSVVDLPGVYSLVSPDQVCGIDEKIATDYLLADHVDVIVNVIDGTHLERHLFLTLQLLELGLPMVVAVNMMDLVNKRGASIDLDAMSEQLGCPVVGIAASRQQNIEQLKQALLSAQAGSAKLDLPLPCRATQQQMANIIRSTGTATQVKQAQFMAWQWLEGDGCLRSKLAAKTQAQLRNLQQELQAELAEETDILIADRRYQCAHDIRRRCLRAAKKAPVNWTERIDRWVLNRWLGVPIFLLCMYLMFFFAINLGGAFQDFFDIGSDTIFVSGVAQLLTAWHAPSWLIAVLAEGLGKGINTTITFIPMIGALFLFLSFLEDSGYMARAAFVMDRFMQMLGLPGEAFVPMIIGFGCNVPAVMGARTLAQPRDRILTVLMMPFMACGARFAIFTVFAAAFFPRHGALIIFALYLCGIAAALFTGSLFRHTCLPSAQAPLVLELPDYRLPQWRSIGRLAFRRVRIFIRRAGKVIVPVCIIMGTLNAITWPSHASQNRPSVLAKVGQAVTPVLEPMGIKDSNWPATVGLISGVLAKEVVVGTLNTLYSQQAHWQQPTDHTSLLSGLKAACLSVPVNLLNLVHAWRNPIAASAADLTLSQRVYGAMVHQFGSLAAAFSYLLFVLLYFPCISTLAVMRREVGRAWANLSMLWSCSLAYVAAVGCYQLLTLQLHPLSSVLWLAGVIMLFVLVRWCLQRLPARWLQEAG
jgi:ferrous iron transport protein B